MQVLQQIFTKARQAKITSLLIIINLVYFLISHLLDVRGFESLGRNAFLLHWGAELPTLVLAGEYWRLFTSLFMHIGISHLALNMIALLAVGSFLEKRIPRLTFIGIYFISGLSGNLLSTIVNINKNIISCGASGAILGLISALLAYFIITRTRSDEISIKSILLSLALTAGLGLFPFIDNMAHLGGAVTGFILGIFVSIIVTKLSYPSKFATIALSLTFALSAMGLYAGYTQYQIPNGQLQLDSSVLINILREQGAGNASYQHTYIPTVDYCIYQKVEQAGTNVDEMKTCGSPKFNQEMYDELESCLALTNKLRKHYTSELDQKRLDTVDHYCTNRKKMYGLTLGIPSDITSQEIDDNKYVMYPLSQEIRNLSYVKNYFYDDSYDNPLDNVQIGVLTDIDPTIFESVSATNCPYNSCWRWY